jgi:hypothetical protein
VPIQRLMLVRFFSAFLVVAGIAGVLISFIIAFIPFILMFILILVLWAGRLDLRARRTRLAETQSKVVEIFANNFGHVAAFSRKFFF